VYGLRCPLTDPAHAKGADGPQTVEDLAAQYVRAMRTAQPYGPYRLIGHSFGGLIAYEMAQQLLLEGESVALLGLLDTHVPAALNRRTWRTLSAKVAAARNFPIGLTAKFAISRVRRRLSMRTLRVKDAAREEILIQKREAKLAKRLMKSYCVQAYAGRVQFFKSRDPDVDEIGLAAKLEDPDAAWRYFAKGGVETSIIPADHHAMVLDPHAALTAAAIQRCLTPSAPP
jgi:thioesterase domain-containing protein